MKNCIISLILTALLLTSCGNTVHSNDNSLNNPISDTSSVSIDYSYLLDDPDNHVGNGFIILHDEKDYPDEIKDLRFVTFRNNAYTVNDFYGNELFSGTSDITPIFCEGLSSFRDENGLIGYMDINGNTVITPQFTYGEAFANGSAFVKKNGEEFYIDKSGNKTDNHKYDGYKGSFEEYEYYCKFTGNYLVAISRSDQGKASYSYLDKNGKSYDYPDSQYICTFENGYAIIEKNGFLYVIDEGMNVVADFSEYEDSMSGHINKDDIFGLVGEVDFLSDSPYIFGDGYIVYMPNPITHENMKVIKIMPELYKK